MYRLVEALHRWGYNGNVIDVVWKILATLGLVVLNAYFVASEFAAVGARQSRLETEAKDSLLARAALQVKHHIDLYLSTCQLGITIASLGLRAVTEPAISVLLTPLLELVGVHAPPGGHSALAITIALCIATSLHVVVGEVAPKNVAIFFPDKLLPILALPLIGFTYLFYPVIWLLNSASNALLVLCGVRVGPDAHGGMPHTEQELRALVRQAVASGAIEKEQSQILLAAFAFGDLLVRQIMTPRVKVRYLDLNQNIDQILAVIRRSEYTRLPLCDKDLDHVLGFVHVKDVLNHLRLVAGRLRFADEKTPDGLAIAIADGLPGSSVHVIGTGDIDLRQITRTTLFVPELVPVKKLLRQFQESQTHFAVVVDEYGSMRGVVTMEDVLEQIVGEIDDEFDETTKDFVVEGDSYRVSGQFGLHELVLKLNLPSEIEEEDVDTVGGYITHSLGRLPRVGDRVNFGDYEARVINVPRRRVGTVLLKRKTADPETPASPTPGAP